MRRNLLVLAVSVVCVASVAFIARRVEAFELPLGVIVVTDGGTAGLTQGLNVTSNLTTRTPFRIPPLAVITVQPDVAAYVCVDTVANLDAGLSDGGWVQYRAPSCRQLDGGSFGVKVAADTAFPSSCGKSQTLAMPDGGGAFGCVVSCVPVSGATVNCPVSQRQANGSPPEF